MCRCRKAIWEDELKGWNVTESAFLNEFLVKSRAEGEARGRLEEAQTMILRFGTKRFGSAPVAIETALLAINDRELPERIGDRMMDASDWNDLLATR